MPSTLESTWRARRTARRRWVALAALALVAALVTSAHVAEVTPAAVRDGLPRIGLYFGKLVPDLRSHALFAGATTQGSLAYWMYRLDSWGWLLFETSQMALLATAGGAAIGLLLSFPAAANLAAPRAICLAVRRMLDLLRTVPDLVYALILVWAFGIGPLPGILALGLHTIGATGKLFTEAVENADMAPWDGVRATGANWAQSVRYAILPQILPQILSYALLRFEINLRSATVLGFVGAGGIGQELYTVISFNYDQEVGAIVVLIIAGVGVVDLLSERLRRHVGSA